MSLHFSFIIIDFDAAADMQCWHYFFYTYYWFGYLVRVTCVLYIIYSQFIYVLCIYIILDKGCHILYVFSLNSTVCNHIVGMHLSSDQVTYGFMMDAVLYNSFLLRLRIKSF